jgi:hypothetical protein
LLERQGYGTIFTLTTYLVNVLPPHKLRIPLMLSFSKHRLIKEFMPNIPGPSLPI